MEQSEREQKIQHHLAEIRRLEAARAAQSAREPDAQWPPRGFYWLFHIVVGLVLGIIGAAVSLTVNVIGALAVGRHPLDLVRVYLTFPMGAAALNEERGKVLFFGCLLYLVTGGLYGVLFHLTMRWYTMDMDRRTRFLIASAIGLGLWIVNFYLILSWLQPALLGGSWILTEIPFWVAAVTHLLFAWTMLLVESWGRFEPYRLTSSDTREASI
ncbi:MAG: hypothetical protein WD768_05205 [Phycisphaeraceae bacterium]